MRVLPLMNILYCGDKDNAPWYIEGALKYLGHMVTHIDMDHVIPGTENFDVIILSDYPAKQIDAANSQNIIEFVKSGNRLVMLGGWESFNGFGRNYFGHPIADLLPVELSSKDDRVNYHQGLLLQIAELKELPEAPDWKNPPIICGYNDAKAKPDSETLIEMLPVKYDGKTLTSGETLPLVVKGTYGSGTIVTCATDLAPHWCGGLIDWGDKRLTFENDIDVGDDYPKFIQFLLEA